MKAWWIATAVAPVAVATWLAAVAIAPADDASTTPASQHWSFTPPRPSLPPAEDSRWPRSFVDSFLLAKMREAGLAPAAEADRETLLRRVTLQLTGLPPTLEEIDAFLADDHPLAYERVVDRLLASPRYGERMALPWLDLARYADTHGYHADAQRDMWRYRDWVIEAHNRDMPFDEFTVKQLAGDLLPAATLDDRIASGFNRNHMINFEDGAFGEEYQAEYVHDRTATTATVWLGQTFACARCHDHKYEPITQRDYYRLFAYFNNVSENGIDGKHGNAAPFLAAPTRLQAEAFVRIEKQIAETDEALENRSLASAPDQVAWERKLLEEKLASAPPSDFAAQFSFDGDPGEIPGVKLVGKPRKATHGKFAGAVQFNGESALRWEDFPALRKAPGLTISAWVYATTGDAMTIVETATIDGEPASLTFGLGDGQASCSWWVESNQRLGSAHSRARLPQSQWRHVAIVFPPASVDENEPTNSPALYLDGRTGIQIEALCNLIPENLLDEAAGRSFRGLSIGEGFRGMIDELRIYPRALTGAEIGLLAGEDRVQAIAATPDAARSSSERKMLQQYYLQQIDEAYRELLQSRRDLIIERDELRARFPTTMIMDEYDPRETHVLAGGDYRQPRERVDAGVPTWLLRMRLDAPANRLGLAQWLVDPDHPLTSRVAVNRYWQMFFGTGLVSAPDDFGQRGERPSHPELLDDLSRRFVAGGWDVKQLVRELVASEAFRQASGPTSQAVAADPQNRLLSHFPRQRLPAESIRDLALASAGMLQERIGGPSIFPPQPPGLWEELSVHPTEYSAQVYKPSHGADLYRRGLYVFVKRSSPPPGLAALDAPDREVCTVKRQESCTPLQALVLMNDPVLFEAARGLACELAASASGADERLAAAFQRIVSRRPFQAELETLREIHAMQLADLKSDPKAADELLNVGAWPLPKDVDRCELAALAVACSALLCLEEATTIP